MDLHIYYYRLFDLYGENLTIGGVQNYLLHLVDVAKSMNLDIVLFQGAKRPFIKTWNDIQIIGIPLNSTKISQQVKTLVNFSHNNMKGADAISLFGADHFSISTASKRAISIQHGVSWDLPFCKPTYVSGILKQIVTLWRAKKYFDNCFNRVCVDYNFINWYRTVTPNHDYGNVWFVPNFCKPISPELLSQKFNGDERNVVRVLFARRFFDYRGTRLLSNVVDQILKERSNVIFTFAGDGPDSEFLLGKYKNNKRVEITRYEFDKSQAIHSLHDIAIIPSLGSEGTTFSVLEAMGSGCAVIATNVGGITNLVINGYNGVLISPVEKELHEHLLDLIDNPERRKDLGKNAWWISRKSFSYDNWKEQWKSIFGYLMAQN